MSGSLCQGFISCLGRSVVMGLLNVKRQSIDVTICSVLSRQLPFKH
jgi:hypothetical protein